jgi:hypothetical protein
LLLSPTIQTGWRSFGASWPMKEPPRKLSGLTCLARQAWSASSDALTDDTGGQRIQNSTYPRPDPVDAQARQSWAIFPCDRRARDYDPNLRGSGRTCFRPCPPSPFRGRGMTIGTPEPHRGAYLLAEIAISALWVCIIAGIFTGILLCVRGN